MNTYGYSKVFPWGLPLPTEIPFLTFPSAVRTAVYTHCSAYTLLQLCQTSPILRSEILANPALISRASGYHPASSGHSLSINDIHTISDYTETNLFNRIYCHRGWFPGPLQDGARVVCPKCQQPVKITKETSMSRDSYQSGGAETSRWLEGKCACEVRGTGPRSRDLIVNPWSGWLCDWVLGI